jgi:hypothetical protein
LNSYLMPDNSVSFLRKLFSWRMHSLVLEYHLMRRSIAVYLRLSYQIILCLTRFRFFAIMPLWRMIVCDRLPMRKSWNSYRWAFPRPRIYTGKNFLILIKF